MANTMIENERGLVGNFVDWCEYQGLDPLKVLDELKAQDWEQPESIRIPSFTVDPEFV